MKYIIYTLILLSSSVTAGTDYSCTITNAVQPDKNGDLQNIGDTSVIGKVFTIDRNLGNMAGVLKNNYLTSPAVIDFGSKESSFKAIATLKNDITSNVYVIIVEEFSPTKTKPFIYLSNLHVYHGTCVHF